MKHLFYSAQDLAKIIDKMNLKCQEVLEVIDRIWENEADFLKREHRDNRLRFTSDILLEIQFRHGTRDPEDEDDPPAERTEEDEADFPKLDFFFKSARINILFGPGQDYVRKSLCVLAGKCGYQNCVTRVKERIKQCLLFYHLEPTLNGDPCDISSCNPNLLITFRIAEYRRLGQ